MTTTGTRHTTAIKLHAAILAAAVTAPGSTDNRTAIETLFRLDESASWFFSDGLSPTQNEATKAPAHVTFRHATGSIKLVNTRERLAQFAADMLKNWAIWGGGEKPATIAKKQRTATWPALLVKVFAEQMETGAHLDALELALNKLGGTAYSVGSGAFLSVAPQTVEDLPSRLKSVYTCAAGWRVIDAVTGFGIGDKPGNTKHRSRTSAEKSALCRWFSLSEATRQSLAAQTEQGDTEQAMHEWRTAHGLPTEEAPATAPAPDTQAATEAPSTPAEEVAADAVAALVADAIACAAIATAQQSAADAVAVAAENTDTQAEELATVATAEAEESTATASPPAPTACAPATACTTKAHASTGTPGAHPSTTTGHTSTTATTGRAPGSTAHNGTTSGPGAASTGQRVAGKSGRWCATLYTDPDGAPGMAYTNPDNTTTSHTYGTGRERMAALQRMASAADAPQQTEPASTPTTPHTPTPATPTPPQAGGSTAQPAPLAGGVPAASAADYTDPLKTSGTDYTHPLKTSGRPLSAASTTSHADTLQELARLIAQSTNKDPEQIGMDCLIGAAVSYTGDACNQPGTGAIVAINPHGFGKDRASVDVMLEDGRTARSLRLDAFGDRPGDRYRLRPILHGAPYMAQLSAAAAMRKATLNAASTLAAQQYAADLETLAAQYSHLERAETSHEGGTLAARNMRRLLKTAFPGVKFSIRSDYSSARINWEDGPTKDQVHAIVGQFDIGVSDVQTDYHGTKRTPWAELFGGVEYMHLNRAHSEEFVTEALAEYWPAHGYSKTPAPTATDWRKGQGVFDWNIYSNPQTRHFRKHMEAKAWPAPAKATRKAKA